MRKKQNFEWASGMVERGVEYAREKRYNEALNCYSRALEVDEKHCDAFVARGKNLYLYKFK